MPIPKVRPAQYRKTAVQRAAQSKKKKAATAPMWKMTITIEVSQFILSYLDIDLTSATMCALTTVTISRFVNCKSCVISCPQWRVLYQIRGGDLGNDRQESVLRNRNGDWNRFVNRGTLLRARRDCLRHGHES